MQERTRVILLAAILAVSTFSVTGIAIIHLYRIAIDQQREQLLETVRGEARMIEAIAHNISNNNPQLSREDILMTTMNQVIEAHQRYEKGGRSTEFTIARRMGNLIVFFLQHRHGDKGGRLINSPIVKWGVGLAEPMQMALSGKSGTIFGRDYEGVRVLAAFEPVADLDLGVVAKIETHQLRAPLVKAGLSAFMLAIFVVLGGVALFQRITAPILQRIKDHSGQLEKVNAALNTLNKDLEDRVEQRTDDLSRAMQNLEEEIRQRRQAQKDLEQSRMMLQSAFDGISDPLLLVDADMTVLILNKAAIRYYGMDPTTGSPQGKNCIALFGKPEACEDCLIPDAVKKGKRLNFERQGPSVPGRLERVVVYPLQKVDKNIGNAVVQVIDVTEAKEAERRLAQSERLASLGMLVSTIAHEISNPNNFISFNLPILEQYVTEILPVLDAHARAHPGYELAGMPYADFREDIFTLINNIRHGTDRVSTFVSNLRQFSQFKDAKPKEWIDLGDSVNRALLLCRQKVEKSVRSFVTDIPENLPSVYSNGQALEQILINLLVNSVQALDKEDSWIRLKIRTTESWLEHVVIEVSDNGCGMDESTLARIYDPFFTTRAIAKGTGIGLYVCRGLVEGLGGRMEARSEPGVGTRFTVFLEGKERRKVPRN